jgi:hypothetical protein
MKSPLSANSNSNSNSYSSSISNSDKLDFMSRRDQGKEYCAACKQVMGAVTGVQCKSGIYHEYCFLCAHCGQQIGAGNKQNKHQTKTLTHNIFFLQSMFNICYLLFASLFP